MLKNLKLPKIQWRTRSHRVGKMEIDIMKEVEFEQVFKNKWNFAVWDLGREKKFTDDIWETPNIFVNTACSPWLL